MQPLDQPGGLVWAADAPDWRNHELPPVKIGIMDYVVKRRAERGQRVYIGQMYGIVGSGLISTRHVFEGLRRPMQVGADSDAACKKLIYSWNAGRDATFGKDPHGGELIFTPAPKDRVFVVYATPNGMLNEFPSIYAWVEHWTWVPADPHLIGAPIDWETRYDKKLWSRP